MTEFDVIVERTGDLLPELRQKVLDYIDILLLDVQKRGDVKPCLTWGGGLSDVSEDVFFLPKKVLLWRDHNIK